MSVYVRDVFVMSSLASDITSGFTPEQFYSLIRLYKHGMSNIVMFIDVVQTTMLIYD